MDQTSRSLMMGAAASGGSALAGYDVNKAGSYLVVPYVASGAGYRLVLIDSSTGEAEADLPFDSSGRIYRFGSNFLSARYGGSWKLYSALSGLNFASGYFTGSSGYLQDDLKFASDKLLTLGWTTYGSSTATAYTFSVSNSGLTQITSSTSNSMGTYNNTYGMINNPVMGGQAYIDATTGLLQSMATIGTKAPYDNSSSAPEARGSMSVNAAGTSISFNGSTNTFNNYSRPIAATGHNGYCLVTSIDGADARIFSGASHGSSSNLYLGNPPVETYAPAAVLGASNPTWITVKSGYATLITTGGTSQLFQIPSNTMVQSIPNGAAWVYAVNGVIKYRKYLWQTGLGSEQTASLVPYSVTNVNQSYGFTKIINY